MSTINISLGGRAIAKSRVTLTTWLVTFIMFCAGVSPLFVQLVSGREQVDENQRMYATVNDASASFIFVSRVFNGLITLFILLLLVNWMSKRTVNSKNNIFLLAGMFIYIFVIYAIGGVFGSFPGAPSFPMLYVSYIGLFCIVLASDASPMYLVNLARHIMGFMVVGSVFSGILFPDWAYFAEVSFDFGDDFSRRLIGFFSHPSLIGSTALTLFSVELYRGGKSFSHFLYLAGAAAAMLLSLSKTSLALLMLVTYWQLFFSLKSVSKRVALNFFGAIMALAVIFYGGMGVIFSNNKENLMTFNGRIEIWALVLANWEKNPIFGNGPAMFTFDGGFEGFAHAHNIVIQALSDAGVFGFAAFALYVYCLMRIAVAHNRSTRGFSVALVLILVGFSMFEPIMRMVSFIAGEFFINVFVVAYLSALERAKYISATRSLG